MNIKCLIGETKLNGLFEQQVDTVNIFRLGVIRSVNKTIGIYAAQIDE